MLVSLKHMGARFLLEKRPSVLIKYCKLRLDIIVLFSLLGNLREGKIKVLEISFGWMRCWHEIPQLINAWISFAKHYASFHLEKGTAATVKMAIIKYPM